MKRLIFLALLPILALATACAPSAKESLEERGFTYEKPHPLLALEKTEERETHSSASGGFFMFIGGGGGSSETKTHTYIGFVMESERAQAVLLKFETKYVDYQFVEGLDRPQVLLYQSECQECGGDDEPTAELIETVTDRVTIQLTRAQFSADIEVLKYAGGAQ